jgi:inner membrane protein
LPSPLAHAAVGYGIYRIARSHSLNQNLRDSMSRRWLLGATIILSLLPDIDAVLGFLLGNFGRYHNNITHSIFAGLFASLLFNAIMRSHTTLKNVNWLIIALTCYELHVIMDFFTVGRGTMLFWPLTSSRFESPIKLFYGLHWSQGWFSIKHIWTLVSELFFLSFIYASYRIFSMKKIHSRINM